MFAHVQPRNIFFPHPSSFKKAGGNEFEDEKCMFGIVTFRDIKMTYVPFINEDDPGNSLSLEISRHFRLFLKRHVEYVSNIRLVSKMSPTTLGKVNYLAKINSTKLYKYQTYING